MKIKRLTSNKKKKAFLSVKNISLLLMFLGFLFFEIGNAKTVLAAITCDSTFVLSADGTKCECPAGKEVLPGQTYCGIRALYEENKVIVGTPNDPAYSEPTTGIYGNTAAAPASKKFEYTLLESFPGFFSAGQTMTDFPTMVLSIYKFGIWTVGIAGLFMLVIGGFMYMASAGNTSTAGNARGIIWDALLGIVAALGAYLILYVINPDLTKINLNFTTVNVEELKKTAANLGKCSAGINECDISKMGIFGAQADQAAHVCQGESGGSVPKTTQSLDRCKDLNIFSVGLFQINLIANGGSFGLNCGNLFNKNGPGMQGGCLKYLDSSNSICIMRDCEVKPSEKARYDACVQKLLAPSYNIQIAKQLQARDRWVPWTAAKVCGY